MPPPKPRTSQKASTKVLRKVYVASVRHKQILPVPCSVTPLTASCIASTSTQANLNIRFSQIQSAAGDKTTGHGTSIFSKDGAVGKQFTADQGGIGGAAQKIGGPLDKDGAIGEFLLSFCGLWWKLVPRCGKSCRNWI